MRKYLMLLVVVIALAAVACEKIDDLEGIDRVRYEADYAVPLVDTKTSLEDLLEGFEENSTLLIDPDGTLRFLYKGDVIAQSSADVFESINESLPPIIPITSPNMALPFTSPDGIAIDRMDLKGGNLVYYFENRNTESVNVKVTFPQVTKNGVPLSYQHNLAAYSGTGNAPSASNLFLPTSLEGYTIATLNDSVYIQYQAITPGGDQKLLSSFIIRIQDLSFAYAEGYFGNFLYEGSRDTINIDFFDDWIRGDIYFEDPRIIFNIENSFGIPTRSVVNVLNVLTVRNEILPLESPFVTNGIDFPYPAMNEIGQVKTSSFAFTKDNSNIATILGAGPVAVDYDVDAITNPNSNTEIRGFITDSSFYKIRLEVELPLYGRASGFETTDTFDVNFSSYEDVDAVVFKLVVDNELPLEVDVQAYLADEQYNVIDSLFEPRQVVVEGAPVNAQGVASGSKQRIVQVPISETRFSAIKNQVRYVLLSAGFSTNNQGKTTVRVLATQDVRIRLGANLIVKN